MPKKESIDKRKEILEQVLEQLFRRIGVKDLMVDFTGSGGMHIWVTNDIADDVKRCTKDSCPKIADIKELNIDIDVFIPLHEVPEVKDNYTNDDIETIKANRVIILPGTTVKGDVPHTYKHYTMPLYCPETPITYTKFVEAMKGC